MPGPGIVRIVVALRGRVQGVGFREHVLAVARRHPVAGSVANLRGSRELEIDVEGEPTNVERFLEAVMSELPPLAHVDGARRAPLQPLGRTQFTLGATKP